MNKTILAAALLSVLTGCALPRNIMKSDVPTSVKPITMPTHITIGAATDDVIEIAKKEASRAYIVRPMRNFDPLPATQLPVTSPCNASIYEAMRAVLQNRIPFVWLHYDLKSLSSSKGCEYEGGSIDTDYLGELVLDSVAFNCCFVRT